MASRFTQADATRATAEQFAFHASVCRHKARYRTKGKAKDAAKRCMRKHDRVDKLSVYQCKCCQSWHLTTVNQ